MVVSRATAKMIVGDKRIYNSIVMHNPSLLSIGKSGDISLDDFVDEVLAGVDTSGLSDDEVLKLLI